MRAVLQVGELDVATMRRPNDSIRETVATLAIVLLAADPGWPATRDADDEAVRLFLQAIDRYITIREQLEPQWPPLEVSDDPQRIRAAIEVRRTTIASARSEAQPGEFFSRAVGDLFRHRVTRLFAGRPDDAVALLTAMNGSPRAVVNGPFLRDAASPLPSVLAVLPPLPAFLQYRIVGPDLVLVDIDAALVLDVLGEVLADGTAR
jgi:hypothetical protein